MWVKYGKRECEDGPNPVRFPLANSTPARSGVAKALESSALSCPPRREGFNSGSHGHRAEAVQGAVG